MYVCHPDGLMSCIESEKTLKKKNILNKILQQSDTFTQGIGK